MPEHRFGGPWTEVKLEAVVYYLECFAKALRPINFELWYIDAFAGSGSREIARLAGGIFEQRPIEVVQETLAGSARRALSVVPSFQHFIFIETDKSRNAALRSLRDQHPDKDVVVRDGNANDELRKIVRQDPWISGGRSRGVVFLDPYALQVEWSTLEALARTQMLDVWYLFPLRDVTRQLAIKFDGIGPKAPMLDRVLGPEWRELYSLPSAEGPNQSSLFEQPEVASRHASQGDIEAWFQRRLESIFAYSSPPLPILTENGRQIFSLFLAVSNPSDKAVRLAKQFLRYSFKQAGVRAFRRRSVP